MSNHEEKGWGKPTDKDWESVVEECRKRLRELSYSELREAFIVRDPRDTNQPDLTADQIKLIQRGVTFGWRLQLSWDHINEVKSQPNDINELVSKFKA